MYMYGTKTKTIVGGCNYLKFKIGKNISSVNWITILLSTNDTYTIKFQYVRCGKVQDKHVAYGVYADQLNTVISRYTGLAYSL